MPPRGPHSLGLLALALVALVGLPVAADTDAPAFYPTGPPLTRLQEKFADRRWLVSWLLAPSRMQPHTAMPDLGVTPEHARAMAAALLPRSPTAAPANDVGGDAHRGERAFVTRGCRGCHAIAPADGDSATRAPSLAGIGLKVRAEWLRAWLQAPRAYDPHTAMPAVPIDDDAPHLVTYLMTLRAGADLVAAAPADGPTGNAKAATLFETYRCAACHVLRGSPAPPPPFTLSPTAAADPAATLRNGRLLVAYYSCRGCHRIEGRDGAVAKHLSRLSQVPPSLDEEGARVQRTWLVDYLQRSDRLEPTALRPWLDMGMPAYGLSPPEAAALADYFAAVAHVAPADESPPATDAGALERGLRRLAHYKCVQCHPLGSGPPPGTDREDLATNLNLARHRLRPAWLKAVLARPKALLGMHTRMPAVFYSVDGTPLVAQPDEDIEAVAACLLATTEPLDVALERLQRTRQSERSRRPVDWRTVDY